MSMSEEHLEEPRQLHEVFVKILCTCTSVLRVCMYIALAI